MKLLKMFSIAVIMILAILLVSFCGRPINFDSSSFFPTPALKVSASDLVIPVIANTAGVSNQNWTITDWSITLTDLRKDVAFAITAITVDLFYQSQNTNTAGAPDFGTTYNLADTGDAGYFGNIFTDDLNINSGYYLPLGITNPSANNGVTTINVQVLNQGTTSDNSFDVALDDWDFADGVDDAKITSTIGLITVTGVLIDKDTGTTLLWSGDGNPPTQITFSAQGKFNWTLQAK